MDTPHEPEDVLDTAPCHRLPANASPTVPLAGPGEPTPPRENPDARAASRGKRDRVILIAGITLASIAVLTLLVVLGEEAAAPHDQPSTTRGGGLSSVGAVGGAAAVLVAVVIVLVSTIVALRLVLAHSAEAAERSSRGTGGENSDGGDAGGKLRAEQTGIESTPGRGVADAREAVGDTDAPQRPSGDMSA